MSSEIDFGETVTMLPLKEKTASKVFARAMAVVTGSKANFTSEINSLLARRLKISSLILCAGFTAFFLKNLFVAEVDGFANDNSVMYMHLFAMSCTGLVAWRICGKCQHFMGHLRISEFIVFGSSAIFFVTLGHSVLINSAKNGFLLSIIPAWQILIFTYALFIPNDWRRALTVIGCFALAPLLILLWTWLESEAVRQVIRTQPEFHNVFTETAMVMVLCTIIAVWGVATIRSLRSQAFEAKQLGQYKLKRLLGKGGMGEVHLAEHVLLKRPCAIKLIRPEMAGNPETLARFEREVQATARLTHWNTVEIFDYGHTEDGTFYYVMEYLPGMNLDQLVTLYGPMSVGRTVHLLAQTCDALGEAHSQGLVHRDIKPANIFAANRGGTYDVVKLLDFGLVKASNQNADLKLTQEGTITGSPIFMAPEQAQGDAPDARSDIYSLGCVAYYLLTGQTPFKGDTAIKLILAHAQQTPEAPSAINPEISDELEGIILRAMEKDPLKRYQSVDSFRMALQACSTSSNWSREMASQWWHNHGCPQKRELDECIKAGREVAELIA